MEHKNAKYIRHIVSLGLLLSLFSDAMAHAIFLDVPDSHSYARSIHALQEQGMIEGHKKEDGRYFYPEQEINRAEALKLLLVGSQVPITRDITSPFSDVTVYDWFYPFVYTAYKRNVVKGFEDGTFQPGNKVILAEFLKMLVVSFDIPLPPTQAGEAWYEPYFKAAESLEITLDDKNPSKNVTRGEAAEMIFRIQVIRYFSDWMN